MNIPKIKMSNKEPINKTLEGVLVNTHVKDNIQEISFDDISNDLLITRKTKPEQNKEKPQQKGSSFDIKKALTPLLIGTGALFLGAAGISHVLKNSSKAISNSKVFEQLPDLALNMNIKQEPHFAMYRMLRDPNFSTIFGGICVFLFSIMTVASKNFVDGVKEVWIKKQSADIERDLQENLISVERDEFSGKLDVINTMLGDNVKYFKHIFAGERPQQESADNFFQQHFSFKGQNTVRSQIIENEKEDKKKQRKKNLLYAGLGALSLGVFALFGKLTFKNLKKTITNANDYANKYTEGLIDAIGKIAKENDPSKLPALEELFQSANAKPDYIRSTLKGIGFEEDTITEVIKRAEKSKKEIFADAPTALGGIPKKIQYYCYLDEDRGHLYNWVTHPENKFAKYVFFSFTGITVVSYLIQQALDAVKSVAVNRENSKTELNLKKRLVEVGINNFKAKKESAIQPLLDTFEAKRREGASDDELKQYARNILTEIKNGPPYVYS